VSDFADLCLASPRAAGRLQRCAVSAPLLPDASSDSSPDSPNDALSPSIGIINSVLIGTLLWIGVVAAITLI
jgi:hypothetical protein